MYGSNITKYTHLLQNFPSSPCFHVNKSILEDPCQLDQITDLIFNASTHLFLSTKSQLVDVYSFNERVMDEIFS